MLALPLAFHPAAALIRRKIRETREQACDELAAAVLGTKGYACAGAQARSVESGRRRRMPSVARPFFRGACHEALGSRSSLGAVPSGALLAASGLVPALARAWFRRPRSPSPSRLRRRAFRRHRRCAGDTTTPSRVRDTPAGGGKRDPFMDLRVHTDKPTNVHDPRAFLIQEVALRGVVRGPKGWTAMVLGPDGRSYFVSAGQVFYDAILTAVDVGGMTVQQQVRDPLAPARVRDLRIALHPDRD